MKEARTRMSLLQVQLVQAIPPLFRYLSLLFPSSTLFVEKLVIFVNGEGGLLRNNMHLLISTE